ncbi:MAG: LysM peptidoglycan-binding domain-containing protein [Candidatus Omnitrophota bacterium]
MRRGVFSWAMAVMFFALTAAAGCSRVQMYTVEKDRVDQDLSEGNAGFFAGSAPQDLQQGRKLTRKTYVTEIELGKPVSAKSKARKARYEKTLVPVESSEEDVMMEETEITEGPGEAGEPVIYKVEANDTLQKISQKFYGTTKKWKTIYDANQDVLKSPDRIYAGQVIKIPQE